MANTKINLTVRLRNKVFLGIFVPLLIAFIYQLLSMLGITPSITQGEIENLLLAVIELLAMLGVVIDPTTSGLGDSEKALTYTEPN